MNSFDKTFNLQPRPIRLENGSLQVFRNNKFETIFFSSLKPNFIYWLFQGGNQFTLSPHANTCGIGKIVAILHTNESGILNRFRIQ